MDDQTAAHLAMIQGVITRMAGNSGMMKASAVAVVAGVAALSATAGPWPLLVALVAVAVTCWMDAFYLRLERLYRHLYDAARSGKLPPDDGPFSMNVTTWLKDQPDNIRWLSVFTSWSVWPFYSTLGVLTILAATFVWRLPNC